MQREKLDIICQKVKDCYRRVFGDKLCEVYLYGSYARGDYDAESDIDFAAIVDDERPSVQRKMEQVVYEVEGFDPDYEALISPKAIPLKEFEEYKNILPYYRNIAKEGARIE